MANLRSSGTHNCRLIPPQQETLLPSPAEIAVLTQINGQKGAFSPKILLCMGLILEKWVFFDPCTPQGALDQRCDHTGIVQDGRAEQVGITVDGERQIDDADGALR